MKLLKKFRKDEKGATAIEYGLIAALISVIIITALTTLGGTLSDNFDEVEQAISGSAPAG